jgi:hypothetical protein
VGLRIGRRAVAPGLLLALGFAIASAPAGAATVDAQARGRQLTRWFFTGKLDSVHTAFDGRMARQMNLQNLRILHDQLKEQLGREEFVLRERVTEVDSVRVYTRLANFEKALVIQEVVWELDRRGQATGFFVRQPVKAYPTAYLEYSTRTALRLPFQDAWFVLWGGRVLAENIHVLSPDERFACDFLLRKDGAPCAGDCSTNAQHFAFGQPILAPAAGKVVAAVDGVPDNVPGKANGRQPLGNYVVIDHGGGEFSFLAHLQNGSLAVKAGKKVHAGDVLARCGNSGRSMQPHLHYHLQSSPKPFQGDGLPAFFVDYVADGQAVERGEPHQLQTVSMPASDAGTQPRAGRE